MSFYTALTGLNAATAQMGVTSNNIANVSTTGFKRSRTDFSDIFATSPLQKASATIGQGVSLKRVSQEFGQGNLVFSSNTLDLAISGDGFFPLKSQDGFQDIFTRNGVFMMNDQNNVVNSAGQKLMAASVDSSGKANLNDMNVLTIPQKTTGMAKQTSKVQLGLNFPADAEVITKDFNRNDPTTYNKSTALTVYDAGGNSYLASVYYVKTSNASQAKPNNKWQTYVYVGDQLVNSSLQQATNSTGELMYVNKYGELKSESQFKTPEEIAQLNSSFSKKTVKFSLDDLTDVRTSQPAAITAGLATDLGTGSNDGIDFGNYLDVSKSDLLREQGSSSVTYAIDDTQPGARTVQFGPVGARVTVNVPANGSTAPTSDEVAAALNNNASFAATYVAEVAHTSASISGIVAGAAATPTTNSPFSKFSVTIGGKQIDVKTLSNTHNANIASEIQTALRAADNADLGGEVQSDITVTYADGTLTITDPTQKREITGMKLTKTANAASDVSTGADPVYDTPVLKITALDPNVSAADMADLTTGAGLVVTQGTTPLASESQQTPYRRAKVDFTMDATASGFKAVVGTGTPIEGTTPLELADNLNKNTGFSAAYKASVNGAVLTITAKDPSNPTAHDIASAVKLYQNSTAAPTEFTSVNKPEAGTFGLTTGKSVYQVTVDLGGGTTQTITGATPQDLVDTLNSNATFKSLFGATLASNGTDVTFTAKDSTNELSQTLPVVTQPTGTGTTLTAVSNVYTLSDVGNSFSVSWGTAPNTHAIAASSAEEFVKKLNADATFSGFFGAVLDSTAKTVTLTPVAGTTSPTLSVKEFPSANFAAVSSSTTVTNNPVLRSGVASILDASKRSVDDLKSLFTVNVDGSSKPVTIGLDHLLASMKSLPSTVSKKLSGTQIAAELTNDIQRAYGDEKPFNFSTVGTPTFKLTLTQTNGDVLTDLPIDLSAAGNMHYEDLVSQVQQQIDANINYSGKVTVSYNTQTQKLVFTPTDSSKITVSSDQSAMNLADPLVQGVNDDSVGLTLSPSVSTSPYRATSDQRYGMKVEYDTVNQKFVFKSGTTGDASSIAITNIRPGSLATQTSKGLGMTGDAANYVVAPSTVDAMRGITSTPAVLTGNALAVNVDNNFSVDSTNNQFVVSVNGITGTVTIPPKDTYTLGTFMEALQNGINNLQGPIKNGLTPDSVNGVKVSYDKTKGALVFTSGTASTDSYIKINGDARWGLDGLDAAFGSTTTWIKPKAFTDANGATVYIDGFGKETSSSAGFDTLPDWSPVYFDKGELTFDTAGNLVSPKQGAQLDTVYLPNGKGALTINIDYSKSTQFASPFSVLSQSQDGAPEGDLVGLAIKDDGLVQASYSNGSTKSLAKVVLVNFSNPSGLRQIGDTNYYKTSESGTPKYNEAGSAGFGTVRSGATERANVDLTQELVDLITEQRNFQANAKAMETSTSMTQTIIQIRN